MLYDVIIIGAGPAGSAAAVYVARKRLKTLLLTESFGGQSIVSDDIQNWIGEEHISGFDLAQKMETHVRAFSDMVQINMPERAVSVKKISSGDSSRSHDFQITTDANTVYQTKSVIVTSGARRRKLNVPGEEKFNSKGVAYCATCDAPLFSGKKVLVVGGGNAGLESVQDLFPYASQVYLMIRGDVLKGDPVTQEAIQKDPKLSILYNTEVQEILGENFVTGVRHKNNKTGEIKELSVDGVFIEIGSIPNSEIVKDLVERDAFGQIVVDAKHGTASSPGIFAAGDVTDDPYKQNNISAGDGVKAALATYGYLMQRTKKAPAHEKKGNV